MTHHQLDPAEVRARPPISIGKVVFDLFLLGVVTAFLVSTAGLHPRAAMVPLIVGIPTAFALAVRTVLDVTRRGRDYRAETAAARPGEGGPGESAPASVATEAPTYGEAADSKRVLVFTVWSLVSVALIALLTRYVPALPGLETYFLPVSFVALVVIFRFIRLSWLKTVVISIALVVAMYYILGDFLHVRL